MNRLEELRAYMEKEGLDGFYIAKPANVRCISGYTGDDSYLFIDKRNQYFITDPRYTEQAGMECPEYTIVNWRASKGYSVGSAMVDLVKEDGVKTIGFEEDYLTFCTWKTMQELLAAEMVPTSDVVESFREVKTPEEIQKLRISCDIASRAFEKILKDIRVGVTEKELASKLSHYMVMEGADTKPYGGILISGAKTSLLHGIPGKKAIEYGDYVLMDYGCQYDGYLSDMTRTVVVGKATDKQREVYNLCRRMTEETEAMIRPGVTGIDCYEASLKAIEGTEYFPYHYTGIGHGVGLFVHELPFIGKTGTGVLKENSVMTVEPGIYIPGWGGVRIEDQGIITADGYENLISATHELIEL
ncbi:MAG: Xaa-Pro peptidase family protein [Eubacteriales bacterium]|nr:Xaa-Pro peptidase family protein [Eubacteriales bacterium]